MPSTSGTVGPLAQAGMIELPGNPQAHRQVTIVELDGRAPFEVRRVYWIHDVVAGENRGFHAHRTTQQLITVVHGAFEVVLDDGQSRRSFVLDDPTRALWVPPGLWRTIHTRVDGSVMLVLASSHYREDDYIRDYDDYLAYARSRAGA